jgi:hypothetical protein
MRAQIELHLRMLDLDRVLALDARELEPGLSAAIFTCSGVTSLGSFKSTISERNSETPRLKKNQPMRRTATIPARIQPIILVYIIGHTEV